ncbi:MAG: STAS domain-containing protein [Clostridia bacterium]|nr:STAS domain-containing protein [Clostridia bacterium]
MNIKKEQTPGKLLIAIEGRLDTVSAPEFEKEIKTITPDIGELELDFAALEYISSAGLRLLLACQKMMNKQGSMIIRNANESIREVLEITGFINILKLV